jgi:HK97 family phage major capsid protein
MSTSNQAAVREIVRSALDTGDLASGGILVEDQVKAFITAFQEVGPLAGLIRWEKVANKSGHIPKMENGSRRLRAKSEGVSGSVLSKPTHSKVEFSLSSIRLDWEITEEALMYNVENEGYEDRIFEAFSTEFGSSTMDLAMNGDTSTLITDPDYNFLSILDGWLVKLAAAGVQTVNGAAAALNKDMFFDCISALPAKWLKKLSNYRWIMHPHTLTGYMKALSDGVGSRADEALLDGKNDKIVGVSYTLEDSVPTDRILLADPANFGLVYNRQMKYRKTDQGKEAVTEDKRIFVLHGDYDPIVYWGDAVVDLSNFTV